MDQVSGLLLGLTLSSFPARLSPVDSRLSCLFTEMKGRFALGDGTLYVSSCMMQKVPSDPGTGHLCCVSLRCLLIVVSALRPLYSILLEGMSGSCLWCLYDKGTPKFLN